MKSETVKEFGKLSFDVAKILLAIGIITPFFKKEIFSYAVFFMTGVIVALFVFIGGYLFNEGVKENE